MFKELWASFWNSKAGKTCCYGFLGLGLSVLLAMIGAMFGWIHGHSFYTKFVVLPLFLVSEIAALGGVLVYTTQRFVERLGIVISPAKDSAAIAVGYVAPRLDRRGVHDRDRILVDAVG